MILIGIMTMWVLSVLKEEKIGRIRVVGVWIIIMAIIESQRKVMMNVGVLGGWYNREEEIVRMEGYIYIISIILMVGYMGIKKGEGKREEGWEMEVEVIMLSITGMVLIIWSNELMTTYIGIELQSLAMYMITSRSERGEGAIAGIKYYILGILSSSILLMGIVMIYGEMGTMNNEGIRMIQEVEGKGGIGGVLMISGILFKLALPPFHNWAPDVYDGVETRITSWIAVMGKVSYMIYIYKVRIYEMGVIEGVIVGSLILGSIMGITQNRIKRLLAYSTINQMGYPLIGILTTGVISRVSYIFYNIQYWVTLINSFCIMIALGKRGDIKYITSINRRSPVMIIALVINMYSLIGIPPLIGFFGKQMVIRGGLLGGYVGIVTVGIITSVVSGAYYLRVIKEVVLKEEGEIKKEGKLLNYTGIGLIRPAKRVYEKQGSISLISAGRIIENKEQERISKNRIGREIKEENEGGGIMWVISIITLITILYVANPRLIMLPIYIMVI